MKTVKNFLLFCAFMLTCVLHTHMAQASVTGKVGVGTWNTQAEFTDVKVVQGTTTLYQSDFTAGMAAWTTVNGTWATANGNLQQTGSGAPALAFITNSTNWSDYTLTLKARKISGDEGFLIAFGSPGDTTASWWDIGGFTNTKHLLQMSGVPASDYAGSITTGVWYDIKVELSGPDVRCYLNGTLIHDTARFLNSTDRTDRFNQLINSPGFSMLNSIEQDALRNLRDRNVYIGAAALATFDAMPTSGLTFSSLSAAQQALILRKVNKNRLTWSQGYGFDGSNTWRDATITANADIAVKMHNALSVFDEHITVNNDPNVATADSQYGGYMRMGSQFSVRTFIHEIAHTLGSGTLQSWYDNFTNSVWTGQYVKNQIQEFDGAGAVIRQSGIHFYPYGLNYDSEYSDENARRAILIVAAMRRDMRIADQMNWAYDMSVASGTYSMVPRHAPNKVLDVVGANNANSAPLNIWTPGGADNQKFLLDLQPEGTYRIRTALTGNRCVEMPGGNMTNGTQVKLWDDNGYGAQRWFLIPTDSGYYKIAPLFNNFKSMEVYYAGTGDGSIVDNYDYTDNFCQQWKIVPSAQVAPVATVPNGTYTLTPRHATDKVLEVYGFNGASGDAIDIWTANGGDNQKFLLDKQSDGTYRIRTNLTGNRDACLPNGTTTNGTKLILWDDDGSASQRWYLIPTDNGWFKIAPKNDITKGVDVTGISTADGALAQSWDYLSGNNQQWRLNRVNPPTLGISDVTVTEGNSGSVNANFTVTRGGDASGTDSVHYTTANGTATAGSDYTALPDTVLNFAAGETTKTVTVAVKGDVTIEANETFFVNLTNATDAAITDAQGVGIIANDDVQSSLAINDVTVNEGNGGMVNANFTVTLTPASTKTVTVNYATALPGSVPATPGTDYVAVPPTTLTFTPGQTSKTVTVQVKGDTLDEVDERFAVNLSSVTNAVIGDNQGFGTIKDDDAPPTLSINDAVVSEGNSGTVSANFTVTLSAASSKSVTVQYFTATPGSHPATAGEDYVAIPVTTLTFLPSETSKSVTALVNGDTLDEDYERFTVNLKNAGNATILDREGFCTINDDDGVPSLSINDVSLAEGNPPSGGIPGTTAFTFTVTLSAVSGKPVTVKYQTANPGSLIATPGTDYTAVALTTLTFAPGQTTKTITVLVNADTTVEGTERFIVKLSSQTNSTLSDSEGFGTIVNDDGVSLLFENDPPSS